MEQRRRRASERKKDHHQSCRAKLATALTTNSRDTWRLPRSEERRRLLQDASSFSAHIASAMVPFELKTADDPDWQGVVL
jgi:hypothetical protein